VIVRWLKSLLARVANSHPYVWFVAWHLVDRLPFLLPHEKSYYALRHLARTGEGLFLDVGANSGASALGFRKLVPHYRILSIEANRYHERALGTLKQKLDRFDYLITGAGQQRAQLTLHTATYRGVRLHTGACVNLEYGQRAYAQKFSPRVVRQMTWSQQQVEVIPLDDLHVDPDIVKIDAEGFDYEVLLGLQQTIQKHRPHVLVEYSPPLQARLEAFCEKAAYVLLAYDHVRDRFSPFDGQRELRAHAQQGTPVNLFLIPVERTAGLPMAHGGAR